MLDPKLAENRPQDQGSRLLFRALRQPNLPLGHLVTPPKGLGGSSRKAGMATAYLTRGCADCIAVIQQVCQMGHEPPAAQGKATGQTARRKQHQG